MIQRHVLAALSAGVEAGDDDAAREAVAHADWVLRGAAKRQLERALIDAVLLTGEHGAADPEAWRHVQRVAALNLSGRGFEVDVCDRARVAAVYATLDAVTPARAPIATIVAASLVVLAMLALVWIGLSLRTPAPPPHRVPHAVAGAFLIGGTPTRDADLEHFLAVELTSLVIETDADRRGSHDGLPRAKHAAELRDAPLIAAHGSALARAWRELIDALDRWSNISIGSHRIRDAATELGQKAQRVSDQFAALGLGYYVQADVMVQHTAHAALFVYRVEDVAFVRVAGERRRVLGLRRLDRLNLTHALLGRQGDELGDPVVLLDQIDEFVTDRVLPTLAGQPYPFGDGAWRQSNDGYALSVAAGTAIRRELAGDEARVRRVITASVRRHEARHAIDIDREKPLRCPTRLAAYLGTPTDDTGKRFLLRTRAELAAYVSQIGNEPVTPQLALWNLASQVFNHERWGSAESYAGVVVIEGLASQLGVSGRPLVSQGTLDRARVTQLAIPLAAQSSDKLRMAARQLWIELYGEPMLPMVD